MNGNLQRAALYERQNQERLGFILDTLRRLGGRASVTDLHQRFLEDGGGRIGHRRFLQILREIEVCPRCGTGRIRLEVRPVPGGGRVNFVEVVKPPFSIGKTESNTLLTWHLTTYVGTAS